MRGLVRFLLGVGGLAVMGAAAAPQKAPAPAPGEIVAAAPAADWVEIAASDLLVMDLAPDARGAARRVVIQLMPPPFSQGWIGNIRKLAAAHWWDGTSINRVQDNYVVQWGDENAEDKAKPLPGGLATVPESEYSLTAQAFSTFIEAAADQASAADTMTSVDGAMEREALASAWRQSDPYSSTHDFLKGWPLVGDGKSLWSVHCYGMVGVGRDLPPNTGSGAELYTVIGHAPRHLDRNIALVGRVISGIEYLSSLPRGTEALGFYKTEAERTTILSVRIATELPAAERPRFQYLSTESASFAKYADARANRRDPFFIVPAGGADICNVPVPVRRVP